MKLFSQSSKNMIFCEASATFQGSHQMLRLPRLLTLCHVCAALTLRLPNAAPATRKRHACIDSNAPVTQNAKMTSHLVTLKRQTEHFVRDFLNFSDFAGNDSVAVCVCVCVCVRVPPNVRKLTTRRGDDEGTATTRRIRREHRSNPRP